MNYETKRAELEAELRKRIATDPAMTQRIRETGAYLDAAIKAGTTKTLPAVARFMAGLMQATTEARGARSAQLGTGYCQELRAAIVTAFEAGHGVSPSLAIPLGKDMPSNFLGSLFGVDCYVDTALPPDALEFECWPRRDGAA
jgi:hypothetical protein